jgi:hypothetical protein
MLDRVLNKIGKPGVTIASSRDFAAEKQLVVAAKGGDESAFETLVKRHQRRIFVVAFRYTRARRTGTGRAIQPAFRSVASTKPRRRLLP